MVAPAQSHELLHIYFIRVLGIAYQTLGDAALATEATETCFKRLARHRTTNALQVWQTLVKVLQRYLVRGINVPLLDSNTGGWQASLLDGLAELAPYDRLLMLLHYREHLTFEQLATVMDDDVEVIRRTLAQVRQQLVKSSGLDYAMR